MNDSVSPPHHQEKDVLENIKPKVFLIGGAPGAGKTTLGSALAARLGVTSLSIDDLQTAAQAITTPESHPKLHVMRKMPSLDYFTKSSIEQLKVDATMQHEAVWPMVEQVVRTHATSGSPIVIDGWYLRPNWVAQLKLKNVWSGWIVASPAVLREREKNVAWYQQSTDPDRMLENFLARSLWYNDLIQEQAAQHQMTILPQPGDKTVEQLCNLVLESSGA
jgi:2-phosphoglycerate kinase